MPANAVEYFVSYYDYYQPEAYVPSTDVYIEKDASINQDLEALRLRATSSLMERDDVVIVSTVSAIYGLGDPAAYRALMVSVAVGEQRGRDLILADLVGIQYQRNDASFEPGTFRVRGDTVEIYPAYDEQAVRIELWGDQVERIRIRPGFNDKDPDEARNRRKFEDLTPLFPDEKLRLESPNDPTNMTARIVDLIAPIGKGQRGLDRVAAQGRQDHGPQADRALHRGQQPRGAPHGAARRRAPRGGHRHAPVRPGRKVILPSRSTARPTSTRRWPSCSQ